MPDPRIPWEEALGEGRDGRFGPGWIAALVPQRVASRALSLRLEVPEVIVAGHARPFRLHVRNRTPLPLSLSLPTGRQWGWRVDGVDEAGTGTVSPPDGPGTLRFGPRERRTFRGAWDGQFRERSPGGDRWTPAPGEHDLSAYLAVADPVGSGLVARATVTVREPFA
jgi:hypothetical protein